MGSWQLHSLWLQKSSLFTFVLKLHPVPTEGLSDSEHSSSSACPAAQHLAPSCRPAQLRELQEPEHLPSVRQEFPLGCCFTCTALLSPQDPART